MEIVIDLETEFVFKDEEDNTVAAPLEIDFEEIEEQIQTNHEIIVLRVQEGVKEITGQDCEIEFTLEEKTMVLNISFENDFDLDIEDLIKKLNSSVIFKLNNHHEEEPIMDIQIDSFGTGYSEDEDNYYDSEEIFLTLYLIFEKFKGE